MYSVQFSRKGLLFCLGFFWEMQRLMLRSANSAPYPQQCLLCTVTSSWFKTWLFNIQNITNLLYYSVAWKFLTVCFDLCVFEHVLTRACFWFYRRIGGICVRSSVAPWFLSPPVRNNRLTNTSWETVSGSGHLLQICTESNTELQKYLDMSFILLF